MAKNEVAIKPPTVPEEAKKAKRSKEMTEALDEYGIKAIERLYEIATNPNHTLHKTRGFEALKTLVNVCAPKRRETVTEGGGNVNISLAGMFKGNSLPSEPPKIDDDGNVIELEPKKLELTNKDD